MVSRRLILKIYLWLLLALTVSIAGAAVVFLALTEHDFEQRTREWVLDEVRPARDVVQNLLRTGLTAAELHAVLEPLRHTARITLQVLGPDGAPLLSVPGDGARRHGAGPGGAGRRPWWRERAPGEAAPPVAPETLARVLAGEEVLDWHAYDRVVALLPLVLADGRPGALYVAARRFRWRHEGPPWRLLAGLAAVLVALWLLSWPLAAHLARPLQRMAAAADALGGGDLSVRIAPRDVQRRHRRRMRHDEIGRLAESFNRMADNLQRLVQGHKQLLADVSHELRSPLARLRLALELARGAQGAEQAAYLESLERQADAMEELIGELLFHARLDEAPYALHAEPLELDALLREALAAQRPEADAKALVLRHHVPAGMGPLRADSGLLRRALANALRNAVAYSPHGGAVDVTVRREAGRVAIAVRDEGPGVPPEQLARIFEPFVRTDAARGRETGGVGLGLAIVRRCMEAHGGGATAAPGPEGRGLVLTLWLPGDAAP
jgi:signal transduction histidine kinase